MFVLGLGFGPFAGLLIAAGLRRIATFSALATIILDALILAIVLFAVFVDIELRLGLAGGMLLGFLLATTPLTTSPPDVEQPVS